MTTIIDRHRSRMEALCRAYRVRRLDVFGTTRFYRFAMASTMTLTPARMSRSLSDRDLARGTERGG